MPTCYTRNRFVDVDGYICVNIFLSVCVFVSAYVNVFVSLCLSLSICVFVFQYSTEIERDRMKQTYAYTNRPRHANTDKYKMTKIEEDKKR